MRSLRSYQPVLSIALCMFWTVLATQLLPLRNADAQIISVAPVNEWGLWFWKSSQENCAWAGGVLGKAVGDCFYYDTTINPNLSNLEAMRNVNTILSDSLGSTLTAGAILPRDTCNIGNDEALDMIQNAACVPVATGCLASEVTGWAGIGRFAAKGVSKLGRRGIAKLAGLGRAASVLNDIVPSTSACSAASRLEDALGVGSKATFRIDEAIDGCNVPSKIDLMGGPESQMPGYFCYDLNYNQQSGSPGMIGNVLQMPFSSNSIPGPIVCTNPHPGIGSTYAGGLKWMEEAYRCLKPGGKLIVNAADANNSGPNHSYFKDWLRAMQAEGCIAQEAVKPGVMALTTKEVDEFRSLKMFRTGQNGMNGPEFEPWAYKAVRCRVYVKKK
jgi:hypothetical protein